MADKLLTTQDIFRIFGFKRTTLARKIKAGVFPAGFKLDNGNTLYWHEGTIKLLMPPAPPEAEVVELPTAKAKQVAKPNGHVYPPERDPDQPGWVYAGQLWHEDQVIMRTLAQQCSTTDIATRIEMIRHHSPDADMTLLNSVLVARATGQLPEPAPPPTRRRH